MPVFCVCGYVRVRAVFFFLRVCGVAAPYVCAYVCVTLFKILRMNMRCGSACARVLCVWYVYACVLVFAYYYSYKYEVWLRMCPSVYMSMCALLFLPMNMRCGSVRTCVL